MRAFPILAALCLFAVPAAADLPPLEFTTFTLGNGLEVILHEDHSTPIVAVSLWYHVGSKNERPGRSGFAHLFEHMMFQGSEHQDGDYFGPLQGVGARLNGSTNEDRTNYWEVVPSNHLERALLMEADRMGWLLPAMTQEKLDNQRDVVRNERRQSENQPYSAFRLQSNEHLFPKGHPYDHSVIGSHEDLQAASLEDVKDFFRSYYTPNNATLCLAGDFEPEAARDWIETYFGEIPAGPPVAETRLWVPEIASEKRVVLEDRVQLPRLYAVWYTPAAFEPGDAEMALAARILGGGKTSRLYERLVHNELLAQEVAAFQDAGQLCSNLIVQITPRPGVDLARVQAILDEEIERFRRTGPSREELAQAKTEIEAEMVKGLQRVGMWDGKAERLQRYNHYTGNPDYLKQDLARHMEPTAESVRKTFTQWIQAERVLFEVHPLGAREASAPAPIDRATLPAGGPEPALELPRLSRSGLDNGLGLLVMEQRELPLVQVELVFRSGFAADPDGRSGLATLAGEMLLEGTRSHDALQFADALERMGTDLNVRTAGDYTTLSMTSLVKHLDASMGLLADAVRRPTFLEEDFTRKRDRRLTDVRREADNPFTTAEKVMRRVVYGKGHPYGYLGAGTEASLSTLSVEEARSFAAAHFTPGNAALLAVGAITVGELEDLAARHFGSWKGDAPPAAAFPAPPARTGPAVYLVDKPGATQSSIFVAAAGVPRNTPDWSAVAVANRALGGAFMSRLNLNLREDKGYTYGARSSFSESREPGHFVMTARVQTEVTAPALTEFMKEMKAIHGGTPLTEKELVYARDSILQGYPLQFETNGEIAAALVEMAVFGLPEDHLTRFPREVAAVDVGAANRAGAEHIDPDGAAVVVVGDLARIADAVRKLDLGPVVRLDAEGNPFAEGASSDD